MQKYSDLFQEFLQKAEAEHKELIILGDLNCDLYTNTASSSTKKLTELLDVYQLKQLIKKPTRVTANTRTLIDVIITQLGNTNVTASGVIHLGTSDHILVYTCRKISTHREKPKIVETRQFKHFNSRAFESDLNQAFAGNDVYHHYDPNEIWNVWKTIFLFLANKHAPLRQRKVRSTYNPWTTTEYQDNAII
jgi:UDP-2,3-diacylglucosamine pyrophosphatase LpxH